MTTRLLSTCALGLALAAPLTAQIPNGGFETWVNMGGYQDPANWLTPNSLLSSGPYVCERGTPGAVGAAYMKVTTRNVPGFGPTGMVFSDVFPYASRPAALNGKWRYDLMGLDEATVDVQLTKWNPATQQPEIIGYGALRASGRQTSWLSFSVLIDYHVSGNPDSAFIFLSATGIPPTVGSYLDVDDLAFGAYQSIDETRAVEISVFPVPASGLVSVSAGGPMAELTLTGADGRLVAQQRASGTLATIDVGHLAPGTYILQVRLADGTLMHRSIMRE